MTTEKYSIPTKRDEINKLTLGDMSRNLFMFLYQNLGFEIVIPENDLAFMYTSNISLGNYVQYIDILDVYAQAIINRLEEVQNIDFMEVRKETQISEELFAVYPIAYFLGVIDRLRVESGFEEYLNEDIYQYVKENKDFMISYNDGIGLNKLYLHFENGQV